MLPREWLASQFDQTLQSKNYLQEQCTTVLLVHLLHITLLKRSRSPPVQPTFRNWSIPPKSDRRRKS